MVGNDMEQINVSLQKVSSFYEILGYPISKILQLVDRERFRDFRDHKLTMQCGEKSASMYVREFTDRKFPKVFQERHFQQSQEGDMLHAPKSIPIRDLLVDCDPKYQPMQSEMLDMCVQVAASEVKNTDRCQSLINTNELDSEFACQICILEQLYPEIDFFHLPAEELLYAYRMFYDQEISFNLLDSESLEKALPLIKEKSQGPKPEIYEFYDRVGQSLARNIFFERQFPNLTFYQLPLDTIEQFAVCTKPWSNEHEFIFGHNEIRKFDRLIQDMPDPSVIGIVFKDENGKEWAYAVDKEKKEKIPMKEYMDSQRTVEQITDGFSYSNYYSEQTAQLMEEACAQPLSEIDMAIKCEAIINGLECRYLLNDTVENMIQAVTERIEYLKSCAQHELDQNSQTLQDIANEFDSRSQN